MNILLINTRFKGGGAERSTADLAEGLLKNGHTCRVMTTARLPGDPPYVQGVRLPGERLGMLLTSAGWFADWKNLGSKLALSKVTRRNADVVHLQNLRGGWISVKSVKALCERVPTVWTLHDEYSLTGGIPYDLRRHPLPESYLRPELRAEMFGQTSALRRTRAFLARHLPRPAIVITPSKYLQQLAISSGIFPDTPVERLPYGLPILDSTQTALSREEARKTFKIDSSKRVVLLVAAYLNSPFKGIPLAIEALRQISAQNTEVLILGRGGEEISSLIPQKSHVAGFVSSEQNLLAAFRAANVILLPSVADNLPYTGLESMACARPFVSFAIGGLTDLAESGGGVAVPPFQVDTLAANVAQLLADPDRCAAMGAKGRAWVEAHCGSEQWIARHEQIYQRACELFEGRRKELS